MKKNNKNMRDNRDARPLVVDPNGVRWYFHNAKPQSKRKVRRDRKTIESEGNDNDQERF
jgi:hypothetical protein